MTSSAVGSSARVIESLEKAIADRTAVIGVVGLGYVGLPVAATFAKAGFHVIGIDRDARRIDLLRAGVNPIGGAEPGLDELLEETIATGHLVFSSDFSSLSRANIITINVDTPVNADSEPNYESLTSACDALAQVLTSGSLVIVESTVSPGTTQGLVVPRLLGGSGLDLNRDLFVGVCPERVMPGLLLSNLRLVPRTCGISTPDLAPVMVGLYATVVEAELDVTDILTAELVKVTENTYRDVQIAFANEVSMICDDLGLDVWKVRELVNKVPFRNMHRPGGGVGGHCLPKDPWLLAAAPHHSQLRLIPAARSVNDAMPIHIANQLMKRVEEWRAREVTDAAVTVAVLGYSYLAESDDVRNSPSQLLVEELRGFGLDVRIHDPFVDGYKGRVESVLDGCQAVVVMVPHVEYDSLTFDCPIVMRVGKRQ